MTTVEDTGRLVALLPEGAPGWQRWLSRAAIAESCAASIAALAGVGPIYPDPSVWLPDPETLLVAAVAMAVLVAGRAFLGWLGGMTLLDEHGRSDCARPCSSSSVASTGAGTAAPLASPTPNINSPAPRSPHGRAARGTGGEA